MDWVMSTKQYRLYYITGLASNNVLNTNPVVVNLSKKVKEDYEKAKQPVKRYSGLMYRGQHLDLLSVCCRQGRDHGEG